MSNKYDAKSVFLCCDLNVQVSRSIDCITGDFVHGDTHQKMEAREFAFMKY